MSTQKHFPCTQPTAGQFLLIILQLKYYRYLSVLGVASILEVGTLGDTQIAHAFNGIFLLHGFALHHLVLAVISYEHSRASEFHLRSTPYYC